MALGWETETIPLTAHRRDKAMTARSTFRLVPIAAACLLAVASLSAQAQVVVNTGPGDNNTGGWSLYSGQSLAGLITLDSQITIGTVSGWMNVDGGTVGFAIYSDVSGILPGTSLYSATVSFEPTSAPEWKSATGLNWTVAPGNYWVVFDGSQASGSMPWGVASPLAAYAGYHPDTGWYNYNEQLNFGVQVVAVPEPETYALMLAGLGLMGAIARRRKLPVA